MNGPGISAEPGAWLVLAVLVLAVVVINWRDSRKRRRAQEVALAYNIAHLIEESEPTAGGRGAGALLVVWAIVALSLFARANGVLQEAVVALIWIGGNQVLCACLLLGRRSTFVVRKPTEKGQLPE